MNLGNNIRNKALEKIRKQLVPLQEKLKGLLLHLPQDETASPVCFPLTGNLQNPFCYAQTRLA